MELMESRFYEPKKINNSSYIVMMAIEKYISQEIFKGNGSRIFYGSDEFALRQRVNKLFPSLTPPYTSIQASQLQFPFANYFRSRNWYKDTRSAIQSAEAALYGLPLSTEIPINVRFLQTEQDYTLTLYFNRDDDAQNAYDILTWMQLPTPKQFTFPGLMYKKYNIDIPIVLTVTDLEWTNEYKEKDWLEKNRIITVRASLNIKTVLLDQYASGSASNMFDVMPADSDIGVFYITREALLDFLSFKNDMHLNTENIVLDITSNFTPDPELNASFNVTATKTTALCVWDYNELAESIYSGSVLVNLNNEIKAYPALNSKTFTFTDLQPESTYTANIYFTSNSGQVIKLSKTFETLPDGEAKNLKGMIGLEF